MHSGGVEVNPRLKKKDKDCLSICLWNLNSISVCDYFKLFLLNSYNSLDNIDIIYHCEIHLVFKTPIDDDNLEISG